MKTEDELDKLARGERLSRWLLISLILAFLTGVAILCLAAVTRKGAEHGGETLSRLARSTAGNSRPIPSAVVASGPSSLILVSNLYSADFARSFILCTNYPAPSPAAGPQEAPTVKAVPISRAVAAPPTNGPIALPQFLYTNIPPNYWWHRLEADAPNGPWRTNDKNMRMPPSGTATLARTNKEGYWQMMGTKNPL